MSSHPALSCVAFQTPRLILREFVATDAEAIQVYAGDPEVTRFTSFGPNTPELTNVVLSHWIQEQTRLPRTEWPLAVVRREDGTLIGGTGFGVPDWSTGAAIFGYVLRRSAWGQGYATEAGQAVADWALGEVGVRRLVAHCEPANLASASVLNK